MGLFLQFVTLKSRFLRYWLASLLVATSALASDPLFRSDVMAVLSKAGCNAGGCHGNATGKGGFKLSLRGQDPDLDWLALTREQSGRRINMIEPDHSLILLKATASIAHEGGARFAVDSPEYHLVQGWLRAGAIDSGTEKKLERLEVTPSDLVLIDPQNSTAITARATFSDGEQRDVTDLAVFDPNNDVAKVSHDGVVTAEKAGETTILVRYLGQQVPVHLAFVPARADWKWQAPPAANYIDEQVFQKLQDLRMNPSEVCSDLVYFRRAYLDLLGVVPTAESARAFAADTSPDKRARLIDRLLEREEFVDFWTLKWADLLKIEERQLDAERHAGVPRLDSRQHRGE